MLLSQRNSNHHGLEGFYWHDHASDHWACIELLVGENASQYSTVTWKQRCWMTSPPLVACQVPAGQTFSKVSTANGGRRQSAVSVWIRVRHTPGLVLCDERKHTISDSISWWLVLPLPTMGVWKPRPFGKLCSLPSCAEGKLCTRTVVPIFACDSAAHASGSTLDRPNSPPTAV